MRVIKLGFGITTLLFVILIVLLNTNSKFELFVKYSKPYCTEDNTYFNGATCSSCGKDIMQTGFIKENLAQNNKKADLKSKRFSENFKSWKDYTSSQNKVLIMCVFVVLCLLSYIVFTVLLFKERRKTKDDKEDNKKKSSSAS